MGHPLPALLTVGSGRTVAWLPVLKVSPFPTREARSRFQCVSQASESEGFRHHGTSLLARDLTAEELDAAPVLASVDALLIEGLTPDEDDAFAAALES
jgi:hypothetical protein